MAALENLKTMIHDQYGREAALARELGWPRQRLNRITTGQTMPDIEELNALAISLHKPVGELIHIFLQR